MAESTQSEATDASATRGELASAVRELQAYLSWAQEGGLRALGDPGKAAGAPSAQEQPEAQQPVAKGSARTTPRLTLPEPGQLRPALAAPTAEAPEPAIASTGPKPSRSHSLVTLEQVRADLGDCTRCKLHKGRNQIVFGAGDPKARLVFVGEAPGEDEDRLGEPFVGKAGQLLTKMIEAMGLSREQVYICNTVKCRPPNNRNPETDELHSCEPFLKGQLAALHAEAIVTLGKFAAQALLRDETPISRLRGAWREYEGIALMPTFHPAYLLRAPGEKAKVWADLQEVMKRLGLAPKPAPGSA